MKRGLSRWIVPAAVVAFTVAQAVASVAGPRGGGPVFSVRDLPSAALQLDTLRRDTVKVRDIWADDDTLGFGALFDEDYIDPRDTTVVPDSLRETDPFRYRWYVALRDSTIRRIVVDSLRAGGDSLLSLRIDSVYRSDSAARAKAAFQKWYNSLDPKARKAYDYQQSLPLKRHRADSIRNAKDSIRAYRDSVRDAVPRILETFAVPDSMQYKKIIAWQHDRWFNQVELHPVDTSFNGHFYDFPIFRNDVGAAWLGVAGAPYRTYDFFKWREHTEGVSFYETVEGWSLSPETVTHYNTKTPYTELSYTGTALAGDEKISENLHILTTQNILPQLNLAFEYNRYGGRGILSHEETSANTVAFTGNWMGRRYLAHGGILYYKGGNDVNGGVADLFWIRDTMVEAREVKVRMTDAHNEYRKHSYFFDQTYRIPFTFIARMVDRRKQPKTPVADTLSVPGDSLAAADTTLLRDTLRRDVTTAFIGTASEYSVYTKVYTDGSGSAAAFDNFFIDRNGSRDSLRVGVLDNRVFLRLQPWAEDAIVSKVEGGIGDRVRSHYLFTPEDYILQPKNVTWNTAYVYAGAEGRLKNYIQWNALGSYSFTGEEANDFFVKASARFSFYPFRRARKSPVSLTARFETALKEPGFYEKYFYSNHYRWNNPDFGKTTTTKLEARIDIPYWKLSAEAGYALVSGNIWYDTLGVARQNTTPVSLMKFALNKNFVIGDFLHLDHRALVQLSSNQTVIPVPLVALDFRYYVQFNIVSANVMKMQLGVNARYNTRWNAPSYNPVAGVFYTQDQNVYGGAPYFDIFANVQWKRACLFIKYENAGMGWPAKKHEYFGADRYILTQRGFKFGIWWPFDVSTKQQKKMSDRAGSGMGGGSRAGSEGSGSSSLGGSLGRGAMRSLSRDR